MEGEGKDLLDWVFVPSVDVSSGREPVPVVVFVEERVHFRVVHPPVEGSVQHVVYDEEEPHS